MNFIKKFFKGILMTATMLASMTLASGQTGVAPNIRFLETDQTLPAGLWRIRLDGDVLTIQKNTHANNNFASATTAISIAANGDVTIPNDFFVTGSATVSVDASVVGSLAFGATPATAGTIRFPVEADIRWRNDADDANIIVLHYDDDNFLFLGEGTDGVGTGIDGLFIRPVTELFSDTTLGLNAQFIIESDAAAREAIFFQGRTLSGQGTRDSDSIVLRGTSEEADTTDHTIDWKQFVDVTAEDGTGSVWTLQSRIDAAAYTTLLSISDVGQVSGGVDESYALLNEASSRTNPTLIANKDELTTGIGGTNSQEISLIVDAIEAVRVDGGQRVRVLRNGVTLDRPDRTTDGFDDSFDLLWTGKGFETATPHDIDWRAFVDVTANDGTGSIWTLQTRIDAAAYTDQLTITQSSSLMALPLDGSAFAIGSTPATAGTIRLPNDATIRWRNDANDADITALRFDDEDNLFLGEGSGAGAGISLVFVNPATEFASDTTIGSLAQLILESSSSPRDAVLFENVALSAQGVRDSSAIVMQAVSEEADTTDHTAEWKTFVDMVSDAGASTFTIQSRIDAASYVTKLTIDDAGTITLTESDPQLIVPQVNDANTPTIAFGDGDSGFYEQTDDQIQVAIAGGATVRFASASMRSTTSGSWQLAHGAASTTVPPYQFQGDTNTGIGHDAGDTDILTLVTGGSEGLRVDASQNILIAGTGPHGFSSGINVDYSQSTFAGSFTSGGAFNQASGTLFASSVTSDIGDGVLAQVRMRGSLTTPGGGATPAVYTLFLDEPSITVGGGDAVGTAATLIINAAPTEATSNFGLLVNGAARFNDGIDVIDAMGLNAGSTFTVGSGVPQTYAQIALLGTFTSSGTSNKTASLHIETTQTAVAGDTNLIAALNLEPLLVTQGATEVIANVASIIAEEPNIVVGAGDTITNAQTLLIIGAPTEGGNNNALRITSGSTEFPDGAAATPSIRFASDVDTGFYTNGAGVVLFTANSNAVAGFSRDGAGNERFRMSSAAALVWCSGSAQGCGPQFGIFREGGTGITGDLALSTAPFVVYRERTTTTDYHRMGLRHNSTTLSSVSGASVTTAVSLIPDGAIVLGVTTDVDVALGVTGGTTGYQIGDGTDADRWGDITGTSTATFSDDADFTNSAIESFVNGPSEVTITANGGNFDGTGDIVVVVAYIEVGARK